MRAVIDGEELGALLRESPGLQHVHSRLDVVGGHVQEAREEAAGRARDLAREVEALQARLRESDAAMAARADAMEAAFAQAVAALRAPGEARANSWVAPVASLGAIAVSLAGALGCLLRGTAKRRQD